MNLVYLLTGTNLGERQVYLAKAREAIAVSCGNISSSSAIYETAAWGMEDQPSFLNQALELQTNLPAIELMSRILKIEASMGRVREEKYGPRIIDIDILFFNDAIIKEEGLNIPHPQLQNRRFALSCMNDMAPFLFHPMFGKSIAELLEECPDPLPVNRLSPFQKRFNS